MKYLLWHEKKRLFRGPGPSGSRSKNAWVGLSEAFRFPDHESVLHEIERNTVMEPREHFAVVPDPDYLRDEAQARPWPEIARLVPLALYDYGTHVRLQSCDPTDKTEAAVCDLTDHEVAQIVDGLSRWLAKVRGEGPPSSSEQESERSRVIEVTIAQIPPAVAFTYRCTYCGSPTTRGPMRSNNAIYPACCSRDECITRWEKAPRVST